MDGTAGWQAGDETSREGKERHIGLGISRSGLVLLPFQNVTSLLYSSKRDGWTSTVQGRHHKRGTRGLDVDDDACSVHCSHIHNDLP